jgi:hypothetical protein
VARLAQAVAGERLARVRQGPRGVAGRLGGGREGRERLDHAVAVTVLGVEDPLVGDVGQQRLGAEQHRPLQRRRVPTSEQALDLVDVDVRVLARIEPDAEPVGAQVPGSARGVERRADAPEGAAQRPARARVQHVGPEAPGQPRPGMAPRVHQQEGEQRSRLDATDLRHPAVVHPHGQSAEQAGAKHGAIMRPRPRAVNGPAAALTVR